MLHDAIGTKLSRKSDGVQGSKIDRRCFSSCMHDTSQKQSGKMSWNRMKDSDVLFNSLSGSNPRTL